MKCYFIYLDKEILQIENDGDYISVFLRASAGAGSHNHSSTTCLPHHNPTTGYRHSASFLAWLAHLLRGLIGQLDSLVRRQRSPLSDKLVG